MSPKSPKTAAHAEDDDAAGEDADTSMVVDGKSPAEVYRAKVANVNAVASPLASRKLAKKLLKAVKKAAKAKKLKRGVKEVVKALRKGEKGLVVIAGDISPVDVITHIPVLCEDASVPYCYVPSKEDLGQAGATKRPTSCVMLAPKDDTEQAAAIADLRTEVEALTA